MLNLLIVTSIFCRPPAIFFYGKKSIPFRQTLKVNRICSKNEFFGKRCNDLEKHPLGMGYSEKMVRTEILRARVIPTDGLLEKINNQEKQNKTTFSITYHPVFGDIRNILKELHVIMGIRKYFLTFI